MAIDKSKYKVVHIPTNSTSLHSSKLQATQKAKAIDGMVLIRHAPDLQYVFDCEYRYGRKK
jgi:hypothetical protein